MKIVVLGGCGDMGSFVVRDIMAHSDAEVVIADYRLDAAKKLAEELGPRASARFVDATKEDSLVEVMRGADAAVGCIGPFYKFAAPMTRAAVKAGVNYVDICDDYGPIPEVLGLDAEARRVGVTAITGLGWTPGITNLMARDGASRLDEVDAIHVAWAGGAADSQGLAVIKHVFYAVTGEVPTYMDGDWKNIPASSGAEVVEFPAPLGRIRVFHCGHPEPLTIPRYIRAKTVTLKGALTPDWNNKLVDVFNALRLINTPRKIDRVAKVIHAIEGIFRAGGVPFSGARVDVIGRKDGQERRYTYTTVDKMGRLTGIPAAIGAVMLAQRTLPAGVFAPEGCLEPEPFFAELAKRNVKVERIA